MDDRVRRYAPYVAAVFLLLTVIAGMIIYYKDVEALGQLVEQYGYIGLFLVVFITNASLFVGIPTPTYIMLAVAAGLNPWVVTVVAALASALGESTGYVLGVGGRKVIEKRYGHLLAQWKYHFRKHAFLTTVVLASLPFPPDDVAGIIAGSMGYDYKLFLLATFIGKCIKYGITAVLTVTGIKILDIVFYD
ncbi:MAG TPA: DedA family protein [Euryarchaeota archaeon]|nr:DedA family protein [Euryarchaeota archaeon]HIQ09902.1 DedA family protein [Euryarchaeota archaeon]